MLLRTCRFRSQTGHGSNGEKWLLMTRSGHGADGVCVAEKMEYHPNSLRLDVGRADHLGPLLSFVGDELLER